MTKKELNSRKRSKSYTPTPLSPGDIREIPTSPLSPSRDRPLPPRLSKSLPGTPLNNSYQSHFSPTSPIISETSEYSYESDSEAEEVFYTTIINSYEKDQIEQKKEIADLHKEVVRLEERLTILQTESEEKDNKLKVSQEKNQQVIKENKSLKTENEAVHLELKLTNSDYLAKTEENQRLTERLNKEVENSKSLIEKLETQWKENSEMAVKQQKLFNQISRLNSDKNLCETKKAELEQAIIDKEKEYRQRWKEREKEHNKQIQNYRLFNSLEEDKKRKRQTVDYGMLARTNSVYLDHGRSDSMSSLNSLSTRVQSSTLDFELALKTPLTDEFENLPATPSLAEEIKKNEESEKRLSTTFDNLLANINDYQQENSQVVEISAEQFAELEARIVNLTQHNQQQEITMQELVQKNTLLQEQLTAAESQAQRVEDLEKTSFTLHQNNLELGVEKDNLQEQLRQKDYQLQSAELKQTNYYNFIKSLAEIFPLSETQKGKLDKAEEPDIKLLSLLKTNIFGGVNKLKNKIAELEEETKLLEAQKEKMKKSQEANLLEVEDEARELLALIEQAETNIKK
ncbi:Putative Viral A-type inclusion protein (fragment) [endosymbiont DhMRE of Dentiscutata heterogama]|uniref:hypothetical protein n=1 Tax=endosymbiont DhMRE of Dentiscutata heterogama TaxID=1609546 RepID=UPI000629DC05